MSDTTDVHEYAQLILDGVDCGSIRKVEGKISTVGYEEVTMHIGTGMGEPLWDWIKSQFDHQLTRKSGTILIADLQRLVPTIRVFEDARIVEIGFPGCDSAAGQRTAVLDVTISPAVLRDKQGDGALLPVPPQSAWRPLLPSRFKLTIDGLEQACSRVSKIDPFSWKQAPVEDSVGGGSGQPGGSTELKRPNLRISIGAADAGAFRDWYEEFVVCSKQGTCGDGDGCRNKRGRLTYLDAAGGALVTLDLRGLGILGVPVASGQGTTATVEISFEGASLEIG